MKRDRIKIRSVTITVGAMQLGGGRSSAACCNISGTIAGITGDYRSISLKNIRSSLRASTTMPRLSHAGNLAIVSASSLGWCVIHLGERGRGLGELVRWHKPRYVVPSRAPRTGVLKAGIGFIRRNIQNGMIISCCRLFHDVVHDVAVKLNFEPGPPKH